VVARRHADRVLARTSGGTPTSTRARTSSSSTSTPVAAHASRTPAGRTSRRRPGFRTAGRSPASATATPPMSGSRLRRLALGKADGSDSGRDGGRNLSARHDLLPATAMNSDITPGESARLVASADGAWLTFSAPLRRLIRAVANLHGRRPARAADRGPGVHLGLRPDRDRWPPEPGVHPLDADRAAGRLGPVGR
jgi:hypothetical protein